MTSAAENVHAWVAPLDRAPDRFAPLLDEEERARADRLVFAEHRRRFTVAHGLLRMVLGRVLAVEPSSLRFVIGPHGKPDLPGRPLHFNLAHSGDRVAIAVAARRDVGVDIEELRSLAHLPSLPRQILTSCEWRACQALPPGGRNEAVLAAWARKEALVKARGDGFVESPSCVQVGLGPGPAADGPYMVRSFDPCAGFVGAVAAEGTAWVLQLHLVPEAEDFADRCLEQ